VASATIIMQLCPRCGQILRSQEIHINKEGERTCDPEKQMKWRQEMERFLREDYSQILSEFPLANDEKT
jgi:uncharacterized C2H2 Zn-finger protein